MNESCCIIVSLLQLQFMNYSCETVMLDENENMRKEEERLLNLIKEHFQEFISKMESGMEST